MDPKIVSDARNKTKEFINAVDIKLSDRWYFHKIGVTDKKSSKIQNKNGLFDTYENLLNRISLSQQIIDVLKIDTEGAEYDAFSDRMDTKPDLLCKKVKQIAVETHSWMNTNLFIYFDIF